MTPSFELLLPLGAVAFYLFDSSALLYGNQLMFAKRGQHWAVSNGSSLMLAGRRVYLPNPLTPYEILLQARWSTAGDRVRPAAGGVVVPQQFEQSVRPVQWVVTLLVVLLFVVLPPVSLWLGAGVALLGVFLCAYLLVTAAMAVVWARRAELAVSPRRFLGLVLESFACLPFAINLVRKLSLPHSAGLDVVTLLASDVDPLVRRRTAELACARIDEYLALEEEGSARAQELIAVRDRIRSAVVVTG
jgi:hypothetical protein